jgi:prepilin-type N-terminal cleavage/methylation domain-containing protein
VSKKKAAFTLAEVLITLGIIGIVAAMTIPTLMSKMQKRQVETQAKVTYSALQQAMRASIDDGATLPSISANSATSMKNWVDTFLSPNMKIEQSCLNVGGCWHKSGVVKTLNNGTPAFETNLNDGWASIGWSTYSFRTAKGAYFNLDGSSVGTSTGTFGTDTTTPTLQFYFDVNGDRKPNVIGKDIYIMVWVSDEKFVPAGHDRSAEAVEQNCKNGNGYWCLEYLMQNNWVIPDEVWNRK